VALNTCELGRRHHAWVRLDPGAAYTYSARTARVWNTLTMDRIKLTRRFPCPVVWGSERCGFGGVVLLSCGRCGA
jgi:hypothetical protein